LVVNYYTRNINDAERITEVFYLTKRKVKERQNMGIYLDVDLGAPSGTGLEDTTSTNNAFQKVGNDDETTPFVLLEQHTYLDLDDDEDSGLEDEGPDLDVDDDLLIYFLSPLLSSFLVLPVLTFLYLSSSLL
jgi:hypothetical protein